jgi:hypothetical protein
MQVAQGCADACMTRKVWMMATDSTVHPSKMSREFWRRFPAVWLAILGLMLTCAGVRAQQAAAPAQDDAKGRELLQAMVTALGGDAWLNLKDSVIHGRTAAFYLGAPTEQIVPYWQMHRASGEERMEYTKKRDIIQIIAGGKGVEITYKGRQYLPQDNVDDVLRRRAHSVEAVARVWMKDPTATVFYMGTDTVGRRQADKIRIVTAQNDNVTLELDKENHLPLRRIFRWRNTTYKDFDEDEEEYDGYQPVQGIQTPFNITRYHNGELTQQRYIVDVRYNVGLPDAMFDAATVPLPKK